MAGVAGDDVRDRVADHARDNHDGWPQSVLCGEQRETRSVAIDDRAGRNAMHESLRAKPCVSKRGWKRRRAGCDHFGYRNAARFERRGQLHELVVAAMSRRRAFREIFLPELAVIIMKAAEFES